MPGVAKHLNLDLGPLVASRLHHLGRPVFPNGRSRCQRSDVIRNATATSIAIAARIQCPGDCVGEIARTEPEIWTILVMNIAREISRRLRRADELLVDAEEDIDVEDLWRNWKAEG